MNLNLKLETENQAQSSDTAADIEALRALAMASIRQDSRENPAAYLRETEAPYGGE